MLTDFHPSPIEPLQLKHRTVTLSIDTDTKVETKLSKPG